MLSPIEQHKMTSQRMWRRTTFSDHHEGAHTDPLDPQNAGVKK